MDENTDLSVLNFPDKLWYMVNEPKYSQIHWNSDGTSIVIPNNHEFVETVFNNPSKVLFKTKHFASFVRQLNLYGFRKVSEQRKVGQSQPAATNRSEFKHPSFLKGRKDLLEEVKRQPNTSKKEESPCEEKPRSINNDVYMQQYASLNPNPPSLSGMWTNWDPFACPFSWMPYGGGVPGSYTMPNPPPYDSQWFYGKDGLPYFVPFFPPMSSSVQYPYDEIYVNGNRDGLNANDNQVPKFTVTLPSQTTTSSVVLNNSLPCDSVSMGNSSQAKSDVNKINGHRNPPSYCVVEEATKKPLPAQTAEVSTTSNASNENLAEWNKSGQTEIRVTDKVTKTREEKVRIFDQGSATNSHKKLKCMK